VAVRSFSGRPVPQIESEFRGLLALFRQLEVSSYLEVGSRHGDSFHAVVSQMPAGSRAVAVDLPNGPWGFRDSKRLLNRAVADLRQKGYDAHAVFGNSHDPATLAPIRKITGLLFPVFDAVLIDADHAYESVAKDFDIYGPMATKAVAFHDISAERVKKTKFGPIGVPRLWNEIKVGQRYAELIDAEDRGMGIGVLFRGDR
jgi:cephalosporin hydroxylase